MIEWHSIDDEQPNDGDVVLVSDSFGVANSLYWAHDSKRYLDVKYWAQYNEPVKKRWMPKEGDYAWWLDVTGSMGKATFGERIVAEDVRNFLGVYKTQADAEAMVEKIKEFITKEIGEV